ncbi:hypothetical protein GMO_01460 [Gluconobacter morbifer G707]|uniref:Transposase n=1 Tax=Gluconobacter morbifer G707 TaxID=1088869 RepID=G6XF81_9PROT|nr:hypothetical protein GMO_01460 [Gluconobacter morbifer G707]
MREQKNAARGRGYNGDLKLTADRKSLSDRSLQVRLFVGYPDAFFTKHQKKPPPSRQESGSSQKAGASGTDQALC